MTKECQNLKGQKLRGQVDIMDRISGYEEQLAAARAGHFDLIAAGFDCFSENQPRSQRVKAGSCRGNSTSRVVFAEESPC
jgi:hypothetical protein